MRCMHRLLPKMAHDRCPRNWQAVLSAHKLHTGVFVVQQLINILEIFIENPRDGRRSKSVCEHGETVASTEWFPQEAEIWQA